MKRFFTLIIVLIILLSSINIIYATKIHQEDGIFPNHSAEYVRTLNRNASTDADAAYYNPAGLAFLNNDGLHIMFSLQSMYVDREIEQDYSRFYAETFGGALALTLGGTWEANLLNDPAYTGNPYDSYKYTVFSPAAPDLNLIYKTGDWAAYFNFSILQGTPLQGVQFDDGLPVIDWGNISLANSYAYLLGPLLVSTVPKVTNYTRDVSINRKEMYWGATLGGSYRILEWLSAALGFRYINATVHTDIEVSDVQFTWDNATWVTNVWGQSWAPVFTDDKPWDIDAEAKGHGFGIIAGLDLMPLPEMNVGIRAEYYTPLIVENKTKSFKAPQEIAWSGELDIYRDGVKTHVTFPPVIALGVSYKVMPDLRVEASFDYILRTLVDYGAEAPDDEYLLDVEDKNAKHRMRKDHWNNGFRTGAAVEYSILPELKASIGYVYNDFGKKPAYREETDFLLNSHTIGGGATYQVFKELDITIGGFYMLCRTAEVTDLRQIRTYGSGTSTGVINKSIVSQKYHEYRIGFAVGVTYRLDPETFFAGKDKTKEPDEHLASL